MKNPSQNDSDLNDNNLLGDRGEGVFPDVFGDIRDDLGERGAVLANISQDSSASDCPFPKKARKGFNIFTTSSPNHNVWTIPPPGISPRVNSTVIPKTSQQIPSEFLHSAKYSC